MNSIQTATVTAIAAYETAYEAYKAESNVLEMPESEDFGGPEWTAYDDADEALNTKYRVSILRNARRVAEDVLIDWAAENLENLQPALVAAFDFPGGFGAFVETARKNLKHRDRLVDLALRFSGTN